MSAALAPRPPRGRVRATTPHGEARRAWVRALRSGGWTQIERSLTDGFGGFCCLGVAARMAGVEPEVGDFLLTGHHYVPVRLRLGLNSPGGQYGQYDEYDKSLANANDTGRTFAEIADVIEREPYGLFDGHTPSHV